MFLLQRAITCYLWNVSKNNVVAPRLSPVKYSQGTKQEILMPEETSIMINNLT